MAYRASPWFRVGANGMQTSGLANFVPESRLPFVQTEFHQERTCEFHQTELFLDQLNA